MCFLLSFFFFGGGGGLGWWQQHPLSNKPKNCLLPCLSFLFCFVCSSFALKKKFDLFVVFSFFFCLFNFWGVGFLFVWFGLVGFVSSFPPFFPTGIFVFFTGRGFFLCLFVCFFFSFFLFLVLFCFLTFWGSVFCLYCFCLVGFFLFLFFFQGMFLFFQPQLHEGLYCLVCLFFCFSFCLLIYYYYYFFFYFFLGGGVVCWVSFSLICFCFFVFVGFLFLSSLFCCFCLFFLC